MSVLKDYLSSRGSDLCKTTQFLSFYALPYVSDPKTHPSFRDLFSNDWIPQVSERLTRFLETALRGVEKPRLLQLLENKSRVGNSEEYKDLINSNEKLREKLKYAEKREEENAQRYKNVQNEYHNLIMVASELVETLANCINGEEITSSYLGNICARLSKFKSEPAQVTESISYSSTIDIDLVSKPVTLVPVEESLVLDYNVIKMDLQDVEQTNSNSCMLLLEALTFVFFFNLVSSIFTET